MEYVIEMLNIRKEFGTFVANDNITLQLRKGEIHALLGENGAGKSTLMNVLFGLYQPEGGEIRVRGEKVNIENPNIANELGIGMVHQHFMLVEKFTVTENIILGSEPRSGLTVDRATARKKVMDISEQYGLRIDPDAKIEDISVGMQQRVEILKTLYRGAEILIFDEPTAVLTPQEIQELIQIMKRLIEEGKSIILITHKLKEIMQVADRCTVIRRGRYIGTVEVDETVNEDSLAEMMVGREVNFDAEYSKADPQQVVLDVQQLVVKDSRGLKVVEGLDLQIRSGEILGIAGIDGNGQTELIEALSGLKKPEAGKILLNGKDVTGFTPRKVTESGVGHIPQDRHKHGLVLDYSIRDNMVLQTYYKEPFSKRGLMNYKAVAEKAKALIEKFDVRTPSIDVPARALSGGNQQKAIIAREVDRSPDLLIAAQPTRGLDVGAIEFIHEQLIKEREKGRAVLLISFELEEILHVSDRIAVLYEGKIVGIRDPKETTEQELGFLMAGGKRGEETV
ncbi:ABC transporter ATP-binding protein [Exiguobacterium sp. SH3S2]|uniref:ABC transporter ATP-binding protein n=1 Tax=unclassified Exiguobacterium TaxID=2644629 RepID=UPI00103AA25A|nr:MULTISPECIES: ABC transporter ATP-binding protein [unclassified Exiguobacterium]TCI27388.1 ABC transporter ATP-binding protein [Exiguobacterium sp. SH5S4]TCI45432.1 ABC transporter ATP-binding protein [Exiguobacterium sp. SH5S32]TCI49289.1 ABC transporter ATP-binding protein [Exiguobacterium sp. SH3S3]TCI52635.1 ABC transporter ATP-binding protein [Exiguobacterium sp. SH1S4]TCI57919.1 ABC transporter ATP-binding protein [Exiguobacterium sp. SH5S13]